MVNQLLTEMDGFRKEELVFVVGTTNFEESLDPALMRPGRFELSINIPYPDKDDRKAIIEIYLKKFGLNMAEDVVEYAVQETGGFADASRGIRFSGDHIYAMLRALKREHLRRGSLEMEVNKEDVELAIGRRKPKMRKLNEEEAHIVAVHEAGHALLAYVLPHCPTVERVTIQSEHEAALGYVLHAMARNQHMLSQSELLDNICVALGGREAEDIFLGEITTGCTNDLHQATSVASLMVEELGMSDELGVRVYRSQEQVTNEVVRALKRRDIAESTAARVDSEVYEILEKQRKRCRETLNQYAEHHGKIVATLHEKKTIGLEEIKEIFDGKEFKIGPKKTAPEAD